MINVGDKFIIEIDKIFEHDGEKLYRAKGFKSLIFGEYGLKMLRRFQDEYKASIDSARIAGQDEAWKLANNLYSNVPQEDIREIFEIPKDSIRNPFSVVLDELTAKEAIEKYSDWTEAKKKEEAEIKIGDVVKHKYNKYSETGVAIKVSDSRIYGLTPEGYRFEWLRSNCTKTGKHIDIESIMEQINDVCNGK